MDPGLWNQVLFCGFQTLDLALCTPNLVYGMQTITLLSGVSLGPSLWDQVVLSVGDICQGKWGGALLAWGGAFFAAKLCSKWIILVPVHSRRTWVRTERDCRNMYHNLSAYSLYHLYLQLKCISTL